MKRAMIAAAALTVLGVIFVGSAGAQATAPSLPDNWQSLPFNNQLSLALRLQAGGNAADANKVILYCGTQVSSLSQCHQLAGAATAAMGTDANGFLAGIVVQSLLGGFSQCAIVDGAWGARLLASQGKIAEANLAFFCVAQNVSTLADCRALSGAATVLSGGDGNALLAGIVIGACMPDFSNDDSSHSRYWGVDLLASQGRADLAVQALSAVMQSASTLDDPPEMYKRAKTVMSDANAGQWLCDGVAGRCQAGNYPVATIMSVVRLLAGEGKSDQAKKVLTAGGACVKTVAACQGYYDLAKTLVPAQADAMAAGILIQNCQGDFGTGEFWSGNWAATLLAGQGKTTEAKTILDATAAGVTTIARWRGLETPAKAILKDKGDGYWIDVLIQKCLPDLDSCDFVDGILALEAVVRVGKTDDGKKILEKLGGRATTVEQVWRMRFPIPSLSPNPDQWMAQVLLSRCKDDMGTCAPNLAAWAVEVIQKGGKAQDAKTLLDALKARAKTVGQARQIVGQLAGLAQRDTVRWAADVLQSSAQGDLATCGLGEAAWAAWVLAGVGQKDQAKALLGEIESGQRAGSSDATGQIEEATAVAVAYQRLRQNDKAKAWMMKAYQLAVGTEEARAAADTRSLASLSFSMSKLNMLGRGQGYPAFASALAGLARQTSLAEGGINYMFLGQPMGTPDSRQILQAEATDAGGDPRVGVMRVLAWAYETSGELDQWKRFLDSGIAAAAGSPDTQAHWLIARAYAESIMGEDRSPLRGRRWLDQALITASSAPVRLEAVREIVLGYAEIGRHDAGSSALDSVAGQFAGTGVAGDVDGLRQYVASAKINYAAASAQYEEEIRQRAIDAWRNEVQGRLDRARAAGDARTAQRLQHLLGNS